MNDLEKRINEANGRLKSGNFKITIEQRGRSLYLRTTLPPKPDSNEKKAFQQRINISSATTEGVNVAEKAAKKLRYLLDENKFDWSEYMDVENEDSQKPSTCEEWAEAFKRDYFARRAENNKSLSTWWNDYRLVFNKLPSGEKLTANILRELVLSTNPDTRTRKRFCLAVTALARFAGIDVDVSHLAGSYSPKKRTARDIPSDDVIAEWFFKVKNPEWRWVYAMLATYGLRNHEVFFLDLEGLKNGGQVISVLQGKTGFRKVFPFHPEWVEDFSLNYPRPPKIDLDRPNQNIGATVTHHLRSYAKIPFQVYDLRHAWAIRSLEYGLDITLAAQQMGHSLAVHANIYHTWINEKHHQEAFNKAINKDSRPLPPKLSS